MMIAKISYLGGAILLFFCISCSRQTGVKSIIHNAENVIEQQPDSALRLLNAVLSTEDLDQSLFNKYNLLLVQAKDKNSEDIASDTIIFEVKDYYIREKDYPNIAKAAFYCGRVLHEQKKIKEATEAYLQAEESADKTKDYNLKGLIYGNLGIIHRENAFYDRAIILNKKAVAMYDKVNNYRNKISALNLIGDCFLLNKQTDSAFYYYHESLTLADFFKITDLQSNVRQNMGVAYQQKENYEQAKKLFIEALSFPNDSVEQARILLNITEIFVFENKIDSVKFYLDKVSQLQIQDPWVLRSFSCLLSKIEKKTGHYQEALKYHEEYYHSTLNLLDNDNKHDLSEIHKKYDLKDFKNQSIKKQLKMLLLFSLALSATVIIIFVLYRKSLQNKRILKETEQKMTGLQEFSQNFSKEKDTFHDILVQYSNILKKAALIESEITAEEQKNGQKLLKKFRKIVYEQDTLDWDKLYQVINRIQSGSYDKIRELYPQWNEMEFRVFCLTCELELTDTVIAFILGSSVFMVRKIRHNLRKKLNISKKRHDFVDLLNKISSISE